LRYTIFRDVMQRTTVIPYRRFRTTYRSQDPLTWDRYVVPKRW